MVNREKILRIFQKGLFRINNSMPDKGGGGGKSGVVVTGALFAGLSEASPA